MELKLNWFDISRITSSFTRFIHPCSFGTHFPHFHFVQEDTVEEKSSSGIDPLSISLYQMDLDRAQFLLRSYLRIRIQKVILVLVSIYVGVTGYLIYACLDLLQ